MQEVLVLYHSKQGSVATLAEHIAEGVNAVSGVCAKVRTVPDRLAQATQSQDTHSQDGEASDSLPTEGPLYCELDDLRDCDALILGSPTRFGNMSAEMKAFWDGTTALWASGDLIDKPAAVFTSSSSMHGGNESTLLSMMLPLLHHGMLISGVPYSVPAVSATQRGGGPYGASRVTHSSASEIDDNEIIVAKALGRRIAEISRKLNR